MDVLHSTVCGGGGVELHVVDGGNRQGQPMVFIHGYSQCWLAWSRQFASDLARDYRLVALDLRGHGGSQKPEAAYADSSVWADDLKAVIQSLRLEQPLLVGWSYGSLVLLDYIRHYGEDRLGGISVVDGLSRLGSEQAMAVISPELRQLVPGFFSSDALDSVRSLQGLLRLCFTREPSTDDLYQMLGYNVSVPPGVRQALFSRALDNDDVMASIRKPVQLLHGARDAIVDPIVVEQHRALMPHAQTVVMPNVGHVPFWEDAPTFNQHLRDFCATV